VEPLEATQEKPLNLGNTTDDDGQVLESLYEGISEPPDVTEAIGEPYAPDSVPAERPTRIITGTLTVLNTWTQPTCILSEDLNRKSLTMTVVTEAATDYVNMADDYSLLSADTSGRLYAMEAAEVLGKHTGPVWVTAANSGHQVIVSWWAVTE
jgi:hypothetical protein